MSSKFVFSLWILGTFPELSLPENQIIIERRKLSIQRTTPLDQPSSSVAHRSRSVASISIKIWDDPKFVFSLWILGTFLELSLPENHIIGESIKLSFQCTTPLDQRFISLLAGRSEVRVNFSLDTVSTRSLIFWLWKNGQHKSYLITPQILSFCPVFFWNLRRRDVSSWEKSANFQFDLESAYFLTLQFSLQLCKVFRTFSL